MKADEALAIGLVDRVVPADELATRRSRGRPSSRQGAVRGDGAGEARDRRAGSTGPSRPASTSRRDAFVEVFGTEDAATGVQSFLEHGPGKARFTGR